MVGLEISRRLSNQGYRRASSSESIPAQQIALSQAWHFKHDGDPAVQAGSYGKISLIPLDVEFFRVRELTTLSLVGDKSFLLVGNLYL